MTFKEKHLTLSKNRHLTIYEKNEQNKLFDDKVKKMPADLIDDLSDAEVLKIDDNVGLTVVVLNIGKTADELAEARREAKMVAKNAINKIALTSAIIGSMAPDSIKYR